MNRRPPLVLAIPAAIAVGLLVLPLVALLQRAPWSSLLDLLTTSTVAEAMRLSLVVSLVATTIGVALGLPLAWLLARVEFPGRAVVRALVLLPMVLPPVVGGTALLFALGRRGLAGQWLDRWFGLTLPFSTTGAVIAATFVAMPFFVLTVEAAIRQSDAGLEDAAATLGATPMAVFRRVTLPLVAPSIAAGAALTWARALGEFGATVAFAGNVPGRTQTLPLATFLALESNPDEAIALSLVLLAVSLVVLVSLRRHWVLR